MARKTIFDIYNEQHATETPRVVSVATNEVVSTPTEEVQPEKVSVQPEVHENTQPITTPISDVGATSLNLERSGDDGTCNNSAVTVSAE